MPLAAMDYKQIFDTSPLAILVYQDGSFRAANPGVTGLAGYTEEELLSISVEEQIHPADRARLLDNARRRLLGEDVTNSYGFKAFHRSGEVRCLQGFFSLIEYSNRPAILVQLIDVSGQKLAEEQIKASEAKYRELADSLPEVVFEADQMGNVKYGNNNCYKFFGCTKEDYERGINLIDYIAHQDRERVKENVALLLRGEKIGISEYMARRRDGSTFPIMIHSIPVFKEGCPAGLRGIIMDITERKEMEERLKNQSLRDPLTGLYNRFYFENEMERLERTGYKQISVIICDVDGLKIINDSFGHDRGDDLLLAAADVLRNSLRDSDIIARIGGDEFAIILPNCGKVPAEKAFNRILGAVKEYNGANPSLPLSLSVGLATTKRPSDLRDLYRQADDDMYREKLHQGKDTRGIVVQALIRAMEAKYCETGNHMESMLALVSDLGRAAGLHEKRLQALRLLARYRDIGMVGIPESILLKQGALTSMEKKEVQRHCEIGYRIAQLAPSLVLIADLILKHHEWQNGEGYPIGLKGEEIPLECRILAIVADFNAMTEDRPYRKALSNIEAVSELKRWAGIQYDSKLVEKFLKILSRQ